MKNFCIAFDQEGNGQDSSGLPGKAQLASTGFLWIHLDGQKKSSQQWLNRQLGLDRVLAQALLDPHVQPRYEAFEKGFLLTLRSVSSAAPTDADALVSIRMWCTPTTLVTVSLHATGAVQSLCEDCLKGQAMQSPTELAILLSRYMLEPLGSLIRELDDEMSTFEDQTFSPGPDPDLDALSEASREAVYLRRHLRPTYGALRELSEACQDWMEPALRQRFRERAEKARFFLEEVELLRERSSVTQSHIESHIAADMNSRLYFFSVLAVLFLPLGFITGLFGINVGGMPGAELQSAFWWFCASLLTLTLTMLLGLRWWRWL